MSTETPKEFSSDNIFDEFSQNTKEIKKEIAQEQVRQSRDVFFYITLVSKVFFIANIILFLFVLVGGLYTFVQADDTQKSYDFLTPMCSVFLGDAAESIDGCYGVKSALSQKQAELAEVENGQSQIVLPLLGEIYGIENFNLSKRVLFLLDAGNNRLAPLEIMSAFDSLKNTFAPVDKSEITCYDLTVLADDILQVTCDAYAADWDASIKNLEDGTISSETKGGTSISRASAFMNFIDGYEGTPFSVLEKPATLSSEDIHEGPYTNKTNFQIKMLYRPTQTVSF